MSRAEPGIGFQITTPQGAGGLVFQLILNPKTYDIMGQQHRFYQHRFPGPRHVTYGSAIVKTALVSGPGVLP